MPDIDLGKVMRTADEDEFWAIRGKAVQAYANVEQALCRIFAEISGTDLNVAGVIFFKITSAQARAGIMEKLLKKKYGTKFNLFRNSFITQLRQIDTERNEIVHWNVINHVSQNDTGDTVVEIVLEPPNYWDRTPDSPTKRKKTLQNSFRNVSFTRRFYRCFTL